MNKLLFFIVFVLGLSIGVFVNRLYYDVSSIKEYRCSLKLRNSLVSRTFKELEHIESMVMLDQCIRENKLFKLHYSQLEKMCSACVWNEDDKYNRPNMCGMHHGYDD